MIQQIQNLSDNYQMLAFKLSNNDLYSICHAHQKLIVR